MVEVQFPVAAPSTNNLRQVVHTNVPLSPNSINCYRSVPFGWEGNRRFGVSLAMRHRLQWIHPPIWAQWLRRGRRASRLMPKTPLRSAAPFLPYAADQTVPFLDAFSSPYRPTATTAAETGASSSTYCCESRIPVALATRLILLAGRWHPPSTKVRTTSARWYGVPAMRTA